jgi:hypothetical protein
MRQFRKKKNGQLVNPAQPVVTGADLTGLPDCRTARTKQAEIDNNAEHGFRRGDGHDRTLPQLKCYYPLLFGDPYAGIDGTKSVMA